MQARNLRGPAGTTRLILCVYIFVVLCTTAYSWWVYEKLRDQPLPLTFDKRPFFEETDRFHDLTNYVQLTDSLYGQAAKLGHSSIVFNYPPPAAFVYKVLLHTFPGHTLAPYLWFLGLCSLGFAVVTWFAAERPTMLPGAVGFAIAICDCDCAGSGGGVTRCGACAWMETPESFSLSFGRGMMPVAASGCRWMDLEDFSSSSWFLGTCKAVRVESIPTAILQ